MKPGVDLACTGFLPHAIAVHGFSDCRIGREAADHFHQRHQRHGVEEVHADQALRLAQLGGDGSDGDRRSIGGEDGFIADDALQVGEQAALDVQVFDDGFDHQLCVGNVGQAGHAMQAATRGVGIGAGHLALFNQLAIHLADVGNGPLDRFRAGVEQLHRVTGGRRDLRDARTHCPAADHGNDTAFRQSRHAYSPLKFGVRLLMKASTPSR
jgi:hypothetical protein